MSDVSIGEAQQELKNLKQEASKLAAEKEGKSTEIPVDKPEPPDDVEVKRAFTEDVKEDILGEARDAGTLRRDETRLNMLSRLSSGEDDVDHFKFETTQPGKTKMDLLGNRDVDVQMLDKFGNVFADSSASRDSEEYKNYTRLRAGQMDLAASTYAVRVERPDSADSGQEMNYGVQLKQGDFNTDLDTVESNDPFNTNKIEEGPRAQPYGNAQEFTKETQDVKNEDLENARDIGRLVQNRSRLNVITTLRNGEGADYYKFDVHRNGEGRLSQLNQSDARVELMDDEGNVIADSEGDEGSEEARNFERLIKGSFEFEKGTYNIKVSPKEGSDIAQGEADGGGRTYGLQLTQGERFSKDYNVLEQGTKEASDASNKYENVARQIERQAAQSTSFLLDSAQQGLPSNGVTSILGGGGGSGILGTLNQTNQSQFNSQIQQIQTANPNGPLGGPAGGGGGASGGGLGGGGASGGGVNQLL